MDSPVLTEAQHVERAVGRIRWGGVALAVVLGPVLPNLSTLGVYALAAGIALYNVAALRLSAGAQTFAAHRRVVQLAFAADVAALSVAELLFSNDLLWTTYFLGTLLIVIGGYRFGRNGIVAATLAQSTVFVALSLYRDAAFGFRFDPFRASFTVAVFALMAMLVDRVVHDTAAVRADRETLIEQLRRRVEEDAALERVMRLVASAPPGADVLPDILRAARSFFRFDRATVYLADEVAGEFTPLARIEDPGATPASRARYPLNLGLLGVAFRGDRALLISNVLEDSRYTRRGPDEPARSVIQVPLHVGGRAVGLFGLTRALPAGFTPDDLRLAETIGGLVAQLLENRRLFVEASETAALREADRLKDEFLATVSHELRTPLTVVSGALELLERDSALGERSKGLVAHGRRNVVRLIHTVDELLDFARLRDAPAVLDREIVSPRALLEEAATAHELIASRRSQSIAVAVDDDVPPAFVDRRRIQQALGNLVSNAIRYAPEGTPIRLEALGRADEIELSVVDRGPGIPAAERNRIFERFRRLDPDGTGGTGLGLAIAKALVELHGGRIWVEDAPGGGSRFVLALPVEPAAVRREGLVVV